MFENSSFEDWIAISCVALRFSDMQFTRRIYTLHVVHHCFERPLTDFTLLFMRQKYNQLWSQSNTIKVVIFAWIFAMVYCTHHLHSDCALIFHGSLSYRWLHNSELCANFDAAVSILIVMAIGSLDFITLIKILAYRKRIRINTGMPIDGSITERDILFFKQSCKLGLLYISCVFAFNVTPHFFTDKWILFAAGTIAWILVKSLDGPCSIVCITVTNIRSDEFCPEIIDIASSSTK
ncbi:hypothetical protein DINM_004109 [Dirofilaria immitis]|nr:hypothetical protein [Dirofilaria immitis]